MLDNRLSPERHRDAALMSRFAALARLSENVGDKPGLALAPAQEQLPQLREWLSRHPEIGDWVVLADDTDIRALYLRDPACGLTEEAIAGLERLDPDLSARNVLTRTQALVLIGCVGLLSYGLWAEMELTLLTVASVLSLIFLAGNTMNLLACTTPVPQTVQRIRLSDTELPVYTVLVPLYREARVVPQLMAALAGLDYPPDKLDIKLLLEADDAETRAAIEALPRNRNISLVVLPEIGPRTKPKALAVGLALARGTLVTVFDAEDTPEEDQLRQAAECFAAAPHLTCLQARLSYRNWRENLLSRQFAIEYAGHFDVLLPFLAWLRIPIALGGTSNHFRIGPLRQCGGWDPYNVTEDADLGIRLARFGFRVGVIDSTTFEEAPFRLVPWFRQRVRWMKGWLQTFLVHMRAPFRLLADLGPGGFLGFHATVTTNLVSAAVNPFAVGLLIWQASGPAFLAGETGFATVLASVASANLIFGYGAALAKGWIGIWRRPMPGLALRLVFTPLYWMLTTAALLTAIFDLMIRPHFWAKTEHGLSGISTPAKLERRNGRVRRKRRSRS